MHSLFRAQVQGQASVFLREAEFLRLEPVLLVPRALQGRPALLERDFRLPAHQEPPVRELPQEPSRYCRCPAQDCFGYMRPKPTSQPKR